MACPQVLTHMVKFPFRVSHSAHPQCSAVFSNLRLLSGLYQQVSGILGSFRKDVNQSFTSSGLALPRVSRRDATKMS